MLKKQAKVVKINLLNETKKYHTSKKMQENKKDLNQEKQFSFSNDKANYSPVHTQLPPAKANQSKKLMPNSQQKLIPHVNGIKKGKSSKDKINEIRKKVEEYNENYEAMNERDQLFKKSIDDLKSSMFNDSRDNKGLTIKTLKEIGKYASNKSRQREIERYSPRAKKQQKPKKDIPVQFYGFDLSEKNRKKDNFVKQNTSKTTQNKYKDESGLSVQQLLKGTYSSFQQRYNEELDHIQKPPKPINWEKGNQYYIPQQISEFLPETFEEVSRFDNEKAIDESQIDVICQIFELCEKFEEGDRIVLRDLQRLMQQLERMFFIKVIQESKAEKNIGKSSQSSKERQFYDVLKQFEKALKIIFYRRKANNIYDALYYLKQSHKLKQVTTNFMKIKSILPI